MRLVPGCSSPTACQRPGRCARHRARTATGLRVGDAETKVEDLYPVVRRQGAWRWLVTRPLERDGTPAYPTLLAKIAAGRVAAFRLNTAGVEDFDHFAITTIFGTQPG